MKSNMFKFRRYGPWSRLQRFRPRPTYGGGGRFYDCPETSGKVTWYDCLECPLCKEWEPGDLKKCKYEYEELKSRGFYAKSQEEWEEFLLKNDPELGQEVIEERRTRERVAAEVEAEREELERMAEELREEFEGYDDHGFPKDNAEGGDDVSEDDDASHIEEEDDEEDEFDEEEDDELPGDEDDDHQW